MADDCPDLASALKHVARLDDRLGVVLIHRIECAECRRHPEVEELIVRMVAARHSMQLERQRLGIGD